jgi:preprotein translocase subunit SecA
VRVNPADLGGMTAEQIEGAIRARQKRYEAKEDLVGAGLMREAERNIMLHVIDDQWKDHLLSMDHLKEGIGLRGYGQKDPLVEYKKESFSCSRT